MRSPTAPAKGDRPAGEYPARAAAAAHASGVLSPLRERTCSRLGACAAAAAAPAPRGPGAASAAASDAAAVGDTNADADADRLCSVLAPLASLLPAPPAPEADGARTGGSGGSATALASRTPRVGVVALGVAVRDACINTVGPDVR